jgi:hypothetical protein
MLKRLREWVQRRVDAAILPHVQRCVSDAAEPICYEKLALHLAGLKEFTRELRTALSSDWDFTNQIASHLDASDIAYCIDAAAVGEAVELDYGNFDIDLDEVAEKLDYRQLCAALLHEMKGKV